MKTHTKKHCRIRREDDDKNLKKNQSLPKQRWLDYCYCGRYSASQAKPNITWQIHMIADSINVLQFQFNAWREWSTQKKSIISTLCNVYGMQCNEDRETQRREWKKAKKRGGNRIYTFLLNCFDKNCNETSTRKKSSKVFWFLCYLSTARYEDTVFCCCCFAVILIESTFECMLERSGTERKGRVGALHVILCNCACSLVEYLKFIAVGHRQWLRRNDMTWQIGEQQINNR